MDLATVQNDLRLQAYKNLELIGGVSTKGRTVIENRGSETFNAFVEDGTVGEDVEVDGIYLITGLLQICIWHCKYGHSR